MADFRHSDKDAGNQGNLFLRQRLYNSNSRKQLLSEKLGFSLVSSPKTADFHHYQKRFPTTPPDPAMEDFPSPGAPKAKRPRVGPAPADKLLAGTLILVPIRDLTAKCVVLAGARSHP